MFQMLAAALVTIPLMAPMNNGTSPVLVMGEQKATTPDATLPKDTCGAKAHLDLIGKPSEAAEVVADPKRILPPGALMTRDYRPDRTNVFLDDAGIIERMTCG